MTSILKQAIIMAAIALTTWLFGMGAAIAQETEYRMSEVEPSVDQEVTAASLHEQNVSSLTVAPIREERLSNDDVALEEIKPNADGDYVLRRETIVGLESIGELTDRGIQDIVQLSGETEPYAFVTLFMRSQRDPRVEVTRANSTGHWEMRIAVDFLPAGEHTAYVQTEVNGTQSYELEVAKFIVIAQDHVSNTTWMFVSLIAIAIVLLLLASTLQIHNARKTLDGQNPLPIVQPPLEKKVEPEV